MFPDFSFLQRAELRFDSFSRGGGTFRKTAKADEWMNKSMNHAPLDLRAWKWGPARIWLLHRTAKKKRELALSGCARRSLHTPHVGARPVRAGLAARESLGTLGCAKMFEPQACRSLGEARLHLPSGQAIVTILVRSFGWQCRLVEIRGITESPLSWYCPGYM